MLLINSSSGNHRISVPDSDLIYTGIALCHSQWLQCSCSWFTLVSVSLESGGLYIYSSNSPSKRKAGERLEDLLCFCLWAVAGNCWYGILLQIEEEMALKNVIDMENIQQIIDYPYSVMHKRRGRVVQWVGHWTGMQATWVTFLSLPLVCSVTLGRLLFCASVSFASSPGQGLSLA